MVLCSFQLPTTNGVRIAQRTNSCARLVPVRGLRQLRVRLRLRLLVVAEALPVLALHAGVAAELLLARLPPAVPVADAIALVAPPATGVLPALLVEHEEALAGQRRIVGLLPAELQHVAAQVAGEVADDFLALALIDPDALQAAGGETAVAVVGFDLHGAERRAPHPEREV